MGKYLKTKEGSIESAVLEAMSPAQQAAIAISKKEKEKKEEEKLTDEELSAKQKKIDLNKNGKVDGDDLKKLRAKADKKEETVKTEAMKPVKANHYDVEVTVSDRDVGKVKKIIQNFNGDIEDVDSDQVDGGGMKFKGTGKIFIMGDDAGKLGMEIAKAVRSVKVMGEEKEVEVSEQISEQVETLAQKAAKAISDMWAEASKSPKEEEEETPKKKESKKTTMTGKPMPDVEINPKSEEK